jgi:hypothetical protein
MSVLPLSPVNGPEDASMLWHQIDWSRCGGPLRTNRGGDSAGRCDQPAADERGTARDGRCSRVPVLGSRGEDIRAEGCPQDPDPDPLRG